ncbi:hypothetical protein Tco_1424130, partial [Tanacetum coccineum]
AQPSAALPMAAEYLIFFLERSAWFGQWLDLTYVDNEEGLIHYILQKQKVSDNDHYDLPLIYNVNRHMLHFGRREFCLIIGFNWVAKFPRELRSTVDDIFLRMVDNLKAWNDFPWGEHIWRELYVAIINVNSKHKDEHHKALKRKFCSIIFVVWISLVFQDLDSKVFIATGRWWSKFSKEIPRGCSWSKHLPFQNVYFGQLFPRSVNAFASKYFILMM